MPTKEQLVRASYRPDGTWSCTRDHVTEPCGECDACRDIQGANGYTPDSRWREPDDR